MSSRSRRGQTTHYASDSYSYNLAVALLDLLAGCQSPSISASGYLLLARHMSPKPTSKIEEIEKSDPRAPRIILRTLPSLSFSTPTHTVRIQLSVRQPPREKGAYARNYHPPRSPLTCPDSPYKP